jgi:hypothetical protein
MKANIAPKVLFQVTLIFLNVTVTAKLYQVDTLNSFLQRVSARNLSHAVRWSSYFKQILTRSSL